MKRDIAAWLETQVDLSQTAPSTTLAPTNPEDLQRALEILEQMAGRSLLASVQLRPGAVIGEGGMGVIREAEQVALGRTVAIKTLKADKRGPESARALLREAWVTGSLEHPNVVPVHHLGLDDDGLPAIVLKRVEGVEWSKLLGDDAEVKRRFGAADLLAWNVGILMQVLNAIRFAHSRGILHRDLKPSNIMVGDFGEVYLLDWGVAVSLRDDGSGRLPLAAEAKQIAGTPCYMAPEMLQPDGDVPLSERTDVYLAGAVLFEIIAGRPPHTGKTALAVMTSVLTSKPELPEDAPAELAAICMRAMHSDADERYESADALRLALQNYLEHRGSDQLLVRAQARLDELVSTLATPGVDRDRHREDVYRLFGACRFGFHEALAVWNGNAAAGEGLARATIALAEYELANGDAQSAIRLLSQLDVVPELLAKAHAAATEQAKRRGELERIGEAHDLTIGSRTRAWFAAALGFFFTFTPFVPQLNLLSYWRLQLTSIAMTLVLAGVVWLKRATLATTLVNRRLVACIVFTFAAQTILVAGLWSLQISPSTIHIVMIFMYFVICSIAAFAIDPNLTPAAICYAIAFLVGAQIPEYWMYAKGAGNFCFALTVVWAWRRI